MDELKDIRSMATNRLTVKERLSRAIREISSINSVI